jgi:hypothetical protein
MAICSSDRSQLFLLFIIYDRIFNPMTPVTIMAIQRNLTGSMDSWKKTIPTTVTKNVPKALHSAYATDTLIFAKLMLKPIILPGDIYNKMGNEKRSSFSIVSRTFLLADHPPPHHYDDDTSGWSINGPSWARCTIVFTYQHILRQAATRKVDTDPVSLARFDKPVAQLSKTMAAANINKHRLRFWPMYWTNRLKVATTVIVPPVPPPPPPRSCCSAISDDDRWRLLAVVLVVDDGVSNRLVLVIAAPALLRLVWSIAADRSINIKVLATGRPPRAVLPKDDDDQSGRLKATPPSQTKSTTRISIQLVLLQHLAALPPLPPEWYLAVDVIVMMACWATIDGF